MFSGRFILKKLPVTQSWKVDWRNKHCWLLKHKVADHTNLKCYKLWSKNHFFFSFRLWKCDCSTFDWQSFKLWFFSKAYLLECKFWISLSAITHVQNWLIGPQRVGSREKWGHWLTSLKFQCVKHKFRSLKAWNSRAAYTRIAFLNYQVFYVIFSLIQLSQDFKVSDGRPSYRKITVKRNRCLFEIKA